MSPPVQPHEANLDETPAPTAFNTGLKALLLKRTAVVRSIDPYTAICYAIFLAQIYAACYVAIGKTFLPGGNVWFLIMVWVFAHVGGFIISLIGLHPLLGQLLAGVVLININANALTGGLKPSWSSEIRSGALALIFLRSGLELDWDVFKKVGWTAVRLLLIPGIVEACVSGVVAHYIFNMPWLLGFTLGFILKAVGPAIVIQLMFDLQRRGRGVDKGVPALVVAAASFDDLVAITFYTIFASLAITGASDNVAFDIAKGPLQLVFGVCGGLLAALLASWTKVFNTRAKRAGIVFTTSLLMMFFLKIWGLTGGGALASLILGMTVARLWSKGRPAVLAKRADHNYAHAAEHLIGVFWRLVAQPLLFGLAGSGINFHKTPASYIPKAIAVVLSGWALRAPTTFFVMGGAGLNWKERLFVTAAWAPKATVQAALAMGPMTLIKEAKKQAPYPQWGEEIFVTAVFAIIICASTGVILVNFLTPRCLNKTITTYNSHLEQKRSNMQPGYEHVVEGSNPSGTGGDTASQPRPPSPVPQDLDHSDAFNPKRRTVSGNVFALPVEQQLPSSASSGRGTFYGQPEPGAGSSSSHHAGTGGPRELELAHLGSGQQQHEPASTGQHAYESAVLTEQDSALAEHLANLERLASGLKDPAAARQLRVLTEQLRKKKVGEIQGGEEDQESASAFFRAHSLTPSGMLQDSDVGLQEIQVSGNPQSQQQPAPHPSPYARS